MQELELTFKRFAAIVWLWFWRALVGGVVLGFIAGFIVGFVGAILRVDPAAITVLTGIVGFIVGVVWSLVALWMALKKNYKEFRIALVSPTQPALK